MCERILDADWIKVDYYNADRPVILVSEFIKGVWFDHYCDLPAEVEPVVHAHWEEFKLGKKDYALRLRCSNCEKVVYERGFLGCPYCRAKMDEEVFKPTPIGKLLFSMRVYKRLKQAGITTMEQLHDTDKRTLYNIEGLGKQSILEIEEKLAEWKEKNNE